MTVCVGADAHLDQGRHGVQHMNSHQRMTPPSVWIRALSRDGLLDECRLLGNEVVAPISRRGLETV